MLKFIRNRATLNVTNITQETMTFDPKEMRSLGYDKIKQGALQQNVSKYYHFETAGVVCNQFNKFVNILRKKKEESKEKYPWLDKNAERKYVPDREILDKYINLDSSCLIEREKIKVRDLLYEY